MENEFEKKNCVLVPIFMRFVGVLKLEIIFIRSIGFTGDDFV